MSKYSTMPKCQRRVLLSSLSALEEQINASLTHYQELLVAKRAETSMRNNTDNTPKSTERWMDLEQAEILKDLGMNTSDPTDTDRLNKLKAMYVNYIVDSYTKDELKQFVYCRLMTELEKELR